MLDIDANPCQSDVITVAVSSKGGTGAVVSMSAIVPLISKWGGPRANSGGSRPGAGRKPKPPTIPAYTPEVPRWYCVRTEYGAEISADMAIRTAGFTTLFPLLWVPAVAARRTELGRAIPATPERLIPLLPRYLLVRFNRADPSWRRICTMRGVERLFSTHPERPTSIPDSDVAELTRDLAPNGCLYPPAVPERAVAAKRRWVDMATALTAMQVEAV
jgi:transcription antitermination factor NusG